MKCPKCGYARSQSDTGPAGECPSCGIIYSKFDPAAEARRVELANKAASRLARAPVKAHEDAVSDGRTARLIRAGYWVAGVAAGAAVVFVTLGAESFGLILLAAVLFSPLVLLLALSGKRRAAMASQEAARLEQSPLMHCMSCGTEFKKPIKGPLRGSDGIEIALWLLAFWAFVPVVYSIWRRSSKTFRPACPACGSGEVVPESTPGAQAHKRQIAV
jgi:hypothetical protein